MINITAKERKMNYLLKLICLSFGAGLSMGLIFGLSVAITYGEHIGFIVASITAAIVIFGSMFYGMKDAKEIKIFGVTFK